MRSAWYRALSTAAGCILVLLLSGCQLTSFIFLCDPDDPKCTLITYAVGDQSRVCGLYEADTNGCIATGGGDPECPGALHCGFQPSALYEICNLCSDPILAEWPDSWNAYSAQWFRAFPPPLSGQVIIEPAANFDLPEGVGPIVTDPGYSAYVLRFDIADIPLDTYSIRIDFEREDLTPMCAKGVQVAMTTIEPGNFRFISPLPGESLDFTSYQAPDPHVLCMPEPTPVQPFTWGLIKSVYR